MSGQQKVFAKTLEGIIDRLEEARSRAIHSRDVDGLSLESSDSDFDVSDDPDRMEAAVLQYESKLEDLTQLLGEELDNLRGLLEVLEEDL